VNAKLSICPHESEVGSPVERLRDDARGRSTTTWLGIEQDFLPVRMLQTEPDGDTFEMRLVEMTR
jgi:hypothetical protein